MSRPAANNKKPSLPPLAPPVSLSASRSFGSRAGGRNSSGATGRSVEERIDALVVQLKDLCMKDAMTQENFRAIIARAESRELLLIKKSSEEKKSPEELAKDEHRLIDEYSKSLLNFFQTISAANGGIVHPIPSEDPACKLLDLFSDEKFVDIEDSVGRINVLYRKALISSYDDNSFIDKFFKDNGNIFAVLTHGNEGLGLYKDSGTREHELLKLYLHARYRELQRKRHPDLENFSYRDFVALLDDSIDNNREWFRARSAEVADKVTKLIGLDEDNKLGFSREQLDSLKEPPSQKSIKAALARVVYVIGSGEDYTRDDIAERLERYLQRHDFEPLGRERIKHILSIVEGIKTNLGDDIDGEVKRMLEDIRDNDLDEYKSMKCRRQVAAFLGSDDIATGSRDGHKENEDLKVALHLAAKYQRPEALREALQEQVEQEKAIVNDIAKFQEEAAVNIQRVFRGFRERNIDNAQATRFAQHRQEEKGWPKNKEGYAKGADFVNDLEKYDPLDQYKNIAEAERHNLEKSHSISSGSVLTIPGVHGDSLQRAPAGFLVQHYNQDSGLRNLMEQMERASRDHNVHETRTTIARVDNYDGNRNAFVIAHQARDRNGQAVSTTTFMSKQDFEVEVGQRGEDLRQQHIDRFRIHDALKEEMDILLLASHEIEVLGVKRLELMPRENERTSEETEELKKIQETKKALNEKIKLLREQLKYVELDKEGDTLEQRELKRKRFEQFYQSGATGAEVKISLTGIDLEYFRTKLEAAGMSRELIDEDPTYKKSEGINETIDDVGKLLSRLQVVQKYMIDGKEVAKSRIEQAEKLAAQHLHQELSQKADRSALHENRYKYEFTAVDKGILAANWSGKQERLFGRVTGKPNDLKPSFDELLGTPMAECAVTRGTSITKRGNITSVTFGKDTEMDRAYIHLHKDFYARVTKITKSGKYVSYNEEGKIIEKECQPGDIIIDTCPFQRSKDGKYIAMSKTAIGSSEDGKYALKQFKTIRVKAVAEKENGMRSTAILFNGHADTIELPPRTIPTRDIKEVGEAGMVENFLGSVVFEMRRDENGNRRAYQTPSPDEEDEFVKFALIENRDGFRISLAVDLNFEKEGQLISTDRENGGHVEYEKDGKMHFLRIVPADDNDAKNNRDILKQEFLERGKTDAEYEEFVKRAEKLFKTAEIGVFIKDGNEEKYVSIPSYKEHGQHLPTPSKKAVTVLEAIPIDRVPVARSQSSGASHRPLPPAPKPVRSH